MKRNSVLVLLAFLSGLGIAFFARAAAGTHQKSTRAADLAAIERLHQEDIEATLSQDPKGLIYIWAEDAVRFNPGNMPAVGKQAIQAENEKVHAQYPGMKVLSYRPKYKDLQIEDGLASEWFERESEFKLIPEGPTANWSRATGRGNSRWLSWRIDGS